VQGAGFAKSICTQVSTPTGRDQHSRLQTNSNSPAGAEVRFPDGSGAPRIGTNTMRKNSDYLDIPISPEEDIKAQQLASEVLAEVVDLNGLEEELQGLVKGWRGEKRRADKAFWVMMGKALELRLALRADPDGLTKLKEKCVQAGVKFSAITPMETLIVKLWLQCGRALAYKYSAALRGAVILGITPEWLSDRRFSNDSKQRVTIKVLIEALFQGRSEVTEREVKRSLPRLKWDNKAVERFEKISHRAPKLIFLVEVNERGSEVVGVTRMAKKAASFLK